MNNFVKTRKPLSSPTTPQRLSGLLGHFSGILKKCVCYNGVGASDWTLKTRSKSMSNITMPCRVCRKEVKQLKDGSDGYEVGIAKWFHSVEPWNSLMILCRKHGVEFMKKYGFDIDMVNTQEPRKVEAPAKAKAITS